MPQSGDINWKEHNSADVEAKNVVLWGWDADNTTWIKLVVNSDGFLVSGNAVSQYQISDQDNSEPAYYGFLRADGAWYIMKKTTTGSTIAYRYAKGASGYDFSNRASETYNDFATEF